MAFTRFHDDSARIIKRNQEISDQAQWIMNVPGNGDRPCFMNDPHIIPQKWGANLWTNTVDLQSSLRGIDRRISRDCLGKDEYKKQTNSTPIKYPICNEMTTEQSRAIMPAWTARELEQVDWYYLPLDPQENVRIPFQNNLSTRILEKDYFVRKQEQLTLGASNLLPLPVPTGKSKLNTCASNNSCEIISNL